MDKNLEYKIFVSEGWDWFVAAKKGKLKPEVLYEGHDKDRAYESILKNLGISVPIEERSGMEETGTYIPKKKDFSKWETNKN